MVEPALLQEIQEMLNLQYGTDEKIQIITGLPTGRTDVYFSLIVSDTSQVYMMENLSMCAEIYSFIRDEAFELENFGHSDDTNFTPLVKLGVKAMDALEYLLLPSSPMSQADRDILEPAITMNKLLGESK